ncbi:MAG: response regulator, partial [Sphingomonadales bacterium]|nr:response regulator [Sphingomonadales bacterium]
STNKTKEQLRQSQKMEAVGQLTGGISHDFNNLLAIILGNLQLLEMNINSDKPVNKKQLKEAVEESIKAGKKGADLTKRLLSFSRKQVLSSSTLIVNQVINDMGSMLTRTLGEHIELAVELDNNLWPVETDISQLENALLNMSINSRDAMPRGGKLIIKTSNINVKKGFIKQHPEFQTGDYVLLEVSDTGTGMDAKTLKKVFEPFFTTKEVGKGSGLGLSMVYGFAKQSGGQVVIVSDVGIGTSIKIYLPRAKATEVNVKKVEKGLSNLTGSETILLVEDDDGVRKVFVRLLDNLGYNVLAARDGDEAIKILGDIEHIDMLLSDVVLPGAISGPEIGKIAQQHFPNIKILYVSGYTEDNHIIQDIEDDNVNLLSKPFEPSELSSKIREIIDN